MSTPFTYDRRDDRPIILIGAGAHARVLIDVLLLSGQQILCLCERDPPLDGERMYGVQVREEGAVFGEYEPEDVLLVNGVGSVGPAVLRRHIFESFRSRGYEFASVVHPSAVISNRATLCHGVQIMAGAVIQPGAKISSDVLINTCASVDHDCSIGAHTHIAPGVTLSGGVAIGSTAHIGTGATVMQNVVIGDDSLVAAGAVVIRDVPPGVAVCGVPARPMPKRSETRQDV